MLGIHLQSKHSDKRAICPHAHRAGAFSLLDLLVTISVMAVLLSLLMPSLAAIRETTRKVVCSSNVRQIGLATAMYADQNRGLLMPTVFRTPAIQDGLPRAQDMMTLRLGNKPNDWDGFGQLIAGEYAATPGVYYCPSHTGQHMFSKFAPVFSQDLGRIIGNYQYRGGVESSQWLEELDPSVALCADGLSSLQDFSHKVGCNLLTADMSVVWFADEGGRITGLLARDARAPDAASRVIDAWRTLDRTRGGPGISAPGGTLGSSK